MGLYCVLKDAVCFSGVNGELLGEDPLHNQICPELVGLRTGLKWVSWSKGKKEVSGISTKVLHGQSEGKGHALRFLKKALAPSTSCMVWHLLVHSVVEIELICSTCFSMVFKCFIINEATTKTWKDEVIKQFGHILYGNQTWLETFPWL